MRRILVFIENDMYVRNFVTSGALDALLARGDTGLVISEHVTHLIDRIPVDHLVGRYVRSPENIRVTYIANKLSMLAKQEVSSTFAIKVAAEWMGAYSVAERDFVEAYGVAGVRAALRSKLAINPTLAEVVARERPELVIVPFTGVESTPAELVQLSARHGFRTLFLVNGWDNLSSKGVLLESPGHLGVVGAQSVTDAVEIQGMPPHRVTLMGCARYEPYFAASCDDVSAFPFPYAVFAGCSLRCDELTSLRILDDAIERAGSSLRIVYRPHPWREARACADEFRADTFRHVVLDPQLEETYYGAKRSGTESVSVATYPELAYYPTLLRSAAFVVSTLSSLIVEAGIFDVPSLLLCHADGIHSISAREIARFRHFDGARDVPGWHPVDALDALPAAADAMIERYGTDGPGRRHAAPALHTAIRHFLHWDERSYADRLRDAAQRILAEGAPPRPAVEAEIQLSEVAR